MLKKTLRANWAVPGMAAGPGGRAAGGSGLTRRLQLFGGPPPAGSAVSGRQNFVKLHAFNRRSEGQPIRLFAASRRLRCVTTAFTT